MALVYTHLRVAINVNNNNALRFNPAALDLRYPGLTLPMYRSSKVFFFSRAQVIAKSHIMLIKKCNYKKDNLKMHTCHLMFFFFRIILLDYFEG